jgi:hypothetical protein
MAKNIPTFLQDAAAVTARNAEYPNTPLSDVTGDGTTANPYLGMNRAGSNAPGIGIATGSVHVPLGGAPRPDNWTELDQAAAARIPQDSQHIGGSGLGAGDGTVEPIRHIVGADVNDTANFVVADTAAVDGAIADTVSGGLNETGETIAIGDLLWARVPVA